MCEKSISWTGTYSTTRRLTSTLQVRSKLWGLVHVPLLGKKRGLREDSRRQRLFKESCLGRPLVTVVTIVFNGERHLEATIQSVLDQTYDNVEYILIDGGSTDGTVDILRRNEEFLDYWVSEPDLGIYDAMNKAAALATGDSDQLHECGRFISCA